jgi:hypothetical protein
MEQAAAMLGVELIGEPDRDWDSLARALLLEIHPGGEAGRVLAAGSSGPELMADQKPAPA